MTISNLYHSLSNSFMNSPLLLSGKLSTILYLYSSLSNSFTYLPLFSSDKFFINSYFASSLVDFSMYFPIFSSGTSSNMLDILLTSSSFCTSSIYKSTSSCDKNLNINLLIAVGDFNSTCILVFPAIYKFLLNSAHVFILSIFF